MAGALVTCDHKPRTEWLPWECTACAIRDLLDEHTPGQPLFKAGWPDRAEVYTGIAHLLRRHRDVVGWPGITKTPRVAGIRYTEGLDPAQVAGLRYGLATTIGAQAGIRALRTKAWLALSWSAGLRMGSDLAAVTRQDVTVTNTGITVALSATKDDPTAAKQVVLGLPWPNLDPDTDTGDLDLVNPTVLLYRWLAVRDAACDHSGPLLPALGYVSTIPTNRPIARHRETAAADLRALTDLAGIDTNYTIHSARRGFASQAHRAGIPVEDISRALRHTSPDPTLGYIDAGGPQHVTTKLLAAAEAAGEPVK